VWLTYEPVSFPSVATIIASTVTTITNANIFGANAYDSLAIVVAATFDIIVLPI